MFCIYCGQEIANTSHFCQYCGRCISPSPTPISAATAKNQNITPAILGLALSVIGLIIISTLSNIGPFLGIPANIASSILCLGQIKKIKAKAIPITGLSLSIVSILIGAGLISCSIASSNFT